MRKNIYFSGLDFLHLAQRDVQEAMVGADWSPEFAHQYHCVHVLPNDLYVQYDEEEGIVVFEDGDWSWKKPVAKINPDKPGWGLRLKRVGLVEIT